MIHLLHQLHRWWPGEELQSAVQALWHFVQQYGLLVGGTVMFNGVFYLGRYLSKRQRNCREAILSGPMVKVGTGGFVCAGFYQAAGMMPDRISSTMLQSSAETQLHVSAWIAMALLVLWAIPKKRVLALVRLRRNPSE